MAEIAGTPVKKEDGKLSWVAGGALWELRQGDRPGFWRNGYKMSAMTSIADIRLPEDAIRFSLGFEYGRMHMMAQESGLPG